MNVSAPAKPPNPATSTAVTSTPPGSANSPTASKGEPALPPCTRTVHVVTMSKGGIGKTLVASALTQYLRDKSRTVHCVDLDPMNHSLAEFKGLWAKSVDLLSGPEMAVDGHALDLLAENMITGDAREDFVLDNGAAGFTALTRYLADNLFAAMLRGYGGRMMVHAVLGGGSMAAQCLVGLDTLLQAFSGDAGLGVQFVLWINEHEGHFVVDGMEAEDMALVRDNAGRIAGQVRLQRLPCFQLDDFKHMQQEKLTYAEALGSPKFLLMNRQRLMVIRCNLWSQLDRVTELIPGGAAT